MRKGLLLLFSLLFCYSCDPFTSRLVLVNETSETIFFRAFTDTTFRSEQYVETAYPFGTEYVFFEVFGIRNYKGWEDKINQQCVDSALHLFIFSTDKITEEVIKNREYVRLSFTVKELDSLNWTVVYRGQGKIEELEE